MRTFVLGIAIAGAILPSPAPAADARNGERLARRWCASCHLITRDEKPPTTEAMPFGAIAHRPGFDENRLAYFLLAPHPKMPDMSLSRAEAADLAAYVAELK